MVKTKKKFSGEGLLLNNYLKINGINQEEFAEKMGFSPQNLHNYFKKERFTLDFKHKLIQKGVDIYKQVQGVQITQAYDVNHGNFGGGNVVLHSGTINGGTHLTLQDHPDYIEGYAYIKGIGQNNGSFLVTGHSMYPTIAQGNRVVIGPPLSQRLIMWNEIYVIDLKEHGAKVKRIRKGSAPGKWLLVSDNKEYGELEVDIEQDVLSVHRVLMKFEAL